jgi:hypothetical protein
MNHVVKACLAFLLAVSAGSIVHAKASDAAWAQCVWRTAPRSAENWLRMDNPSWADNMSSPEELLGHRLIAICSTTAAEARNPNRNPNWNALRTRLKRARPAAAGSADAATPGVYLCRNYAKVDGRDQLYRIDVLRTEGTARTVIFQQYFSDNRGTPLRLPRDMRIVPANDGKGWGICRPITSEGALADA